MNKKIYFNNLYDYYSKLFTDKQCKYFEDYYFKDLSLAEIAENNNVSRNAVFGQIKIVLEKLEFYEAMLGLYRKKNEIEKIISDIDPNIKDKIKELI